MNCAVHSQTQATAYCRTCGKALCEDCKRDVMGAIYCEPCIAARLQSQPPVVMAAPRPPGTPSPAMAGFLGFIPGVGAMYNGQFVKALAHVVIFVLLIIATDSISGYFGILIGFFVFYMAFEAYKTAEAHRLGLPAPDPLGLDRMFGLEEPQPQHAVAMGTAANPGMGAGTPVMPASAPVQVAPPPPPAQDNTPVGAIVLLALGCVFLLTNFGLLRVGTIAPLVLIGFGLWLAYKRIHQPA